MHPVITGQRARRWHREGKCRPTFAPIGPVWQHGRMASDHESTSLAAAAEVAPIVPAAPTGPALFEHDGLALYHESWGHDQAPAVVAFHEAGHDLRMWWPLIRGLSDAYRIVAIDLPGHGKSPSIEPGTWKATDIAAFAAALLAAEGIDIAAAVGCGLGARVAIELARSSPSLIAALVITDLVPSSAAPGSGWGAYPPDPAEDIVARRGPRELGKHMALGFHEHFYARGLRARYDALDRDGLLGAFVALRDAPALEGQSLNCPTLVCAGEHDTAHDHAQTFAASLPHARLLSFKDAGRPLVNARPVDFSEQVFRFLRAVEEGEKVSGRRSI